MQPDRHGHFGRFGGRFVPETLMPALLELEQAYRRISRDPEFQQELAWHLKEYVGRPTPLYLARHLSETLGGPRIYLKREDLAHTGAHKINNTFMGTEDIRRQRLNVMRMKLLGARVIPVESGSCTLKDAMNEAIRDWVTYVRHTHYVIGSVAGPHPYPMLVRDFQAVIGREARAQIRRHAGKLPRRHPGGWHRGSAPRLFELPATG